MATTEVEDVGRAEASAWWRESRFPLFVASRMLSLTGDMAATTALTVHIYQETQSGPAISGLFVARVLPRLLGLFAGAISDGVDLCRLMIICDVASFAVFLGLAWLDPSYLAMLGLVLAAEVAATIASPAAESVVARTVPESARGRANGIMMAVMTIGFATGSAVGGLAAGLWDYRIALIVNSGTFVLSATLVAFLPRIPPVASKAATGTSMLASIRGGLHQLRVDPILLLVTLCTVGVTFAGAIDRPAVVFLAEHDLNAQGIGYGLALGGVSIGALAATAMVGRVRHLDASALLFTVGLLAQAVGHLMMGFAPVLLVLVGAAVIAGYGNGLESISGMTLLQNKGEATSIGMLMGVLATGSYLANAVGSVLGGLLVNAAGPRWTFAAAAALMAGLSLLALRTRSAGSTELAAPSTT
ncbi:MFS transporter [Streptomyces sp. NPDC001185]|uniref:MFS transporter n=1 Tax=Streptomyces sp. NPDC001185 TaxID=3154380 RepID=UPI00331CBBC9